MMIRRSLFGRTQKVRTKLPCTPYWLITLLHRLWEKERDRRTIASWCCILRTKRKKYRSAMYYCYNYVKLHAHYTHDSEDDACMCYAAGFLRYRTGDRTHFRWGERREGEQKKNDDGVFMFLVFLLTHTYEKNIPAKFVFVLRNLSHAVIACELVPRFRPKRIHSYEPVFLNFCPLTNYVFVSPLCRMVRHENLNS